MTMIDVIVRGIRVQLNPDEFPTATREAALVAGFRKLLQDGVNAALQADESIEPAEAVKARLDEMKRGDVRVRAERPDEMSETDVAKARVLSAIAPMFPALGKVWNATKGVPTRERRRALLAAYAAMPEKARNAVDALIASAPELEADEMD